jgi:hypothetical protein
VHLRAGRQRDEGDRDAVEDAQASLYEDAEEIAAFVERMQQQMDAYTGGPRGLDAVKATCESIRESAAELRAAAQAAPPEPTTQRAALEAHEKRANDLRRWRAALASGKPVDMPAVDPDAPDPVRKAHKALEVYQARCH